MADLILIGCGVLLVLILGILIGLQMDTDAHRARWRAVARERRYQPHATHGRAAPP